MIIKDDASIRELVKDLNKLSTKVFIYDGIIKKSTNPNQFLKELNRVLAKEELIRF